MTVRNANLLTASSLWWAASAQRWRPFHIKISLVVCNGVRAAPPHEPLVLPPNFRDVTAEKVGIVVAIVGATGFNSEAEGIFDIFKSLGAGELFKTMSGTDIVHVPYKSSAGARNDIIGGQVQMMFDTISTMKPNVEAGLVKALGTSGLERSPIVPDVPTISEAGVPGFTASGWVGIVAPAGTPKPIVDLLNTEINKILNSSMIEESWAKQGVARLSMTPDEFRDFIKAEIDKWAKVAQTAGVKIN